MPMRKFVTGAGRKSEPSVPDCGTKELHEVPADKLRQTEGVNVPGALVTFDPDTREAQALRGALSFLFTLITFYGELLEQDASAADGRSDRGDSSLH